MRGRKGDERVGEAVTEGFCYITMHYPLALQPDEEAFFWLRVWDFGQDGVTTRVGLKQEAGHWDLYQMTHHVPYLTSEHV